MLEVTFGFSEAVFAIVLVGGGALIYLIKRVFDSYDHNKTNNLIDSNHNNKSHSD